MTRQIIYPGFLVASIRLYEAVCTPVTTAVSRGLVALITWRRARQRRRQARRSIAHLGALNDHNLTDLGLVRTDISRIAHEFYTEWNTDDADD